MIGGMISSTLLTLIVIPAIFGLVNGLWLPSSDHGEHQLPARTELMVKPARIPEPAE
jgi:Cu(I)/Ag(I) efflux system membrane protein CusA/SilA